MVRSLSVTGITTLRPWRVCVFALESCPQRPRFPNCAHLAGPDVSHWAETIEALTICHYQCHRSASIFWGPDFKHGTSKLLVDRKNVVPTLTGCSTTRRCMRSVRCERKCWPSMSGQHPSTSPGQPDKTQGRTAKRKGRPHAAPFLMAKRSQRKVAKDAKWLGSESVRVNQPLRFCVFALNSCPFPPPIKKARGATPPWPKVTKDQ